MNKTMERELFVIRHGQTADFRVKKYFILLLIVTVIAVLTGWVAALTVLGGMAVSGVCVHFMLRAKTDGWKKSWGPYKRLKNLP